MLLDHHGKVKTDINADQYYLLPGVLIEFEGTTRRLIDASNEDCPLDKSNVCLGQKKNEANMAKKNFPHLRKNSHVET